MRHSAGCNNMDTWMRGAIGCGRGVRGAITRVWQRGDRGLQ